MARTDTLGNFLTDVADAIREKKGTSETIQASDFDTEIENLPSGGGLDWSAIGYDSTPQAIQDGYDYAVEIKNNWIPTDNLRNKFSADKKIIFMPLVDTSTATNMYGMFTGCSSLTSVPLLNTSNTTITQTMFSNCERLSIVPQFDTSNVNNMQGMFNYCTSLTTVPQFNTSKVKYMNNMFYNCPSLSDESLNNILKMCINTTTEYIGTKTLSRLGFMNSVTPSSKIQSLPSYQDFLDAGWTIGY